MRCKECGQIVKKELVEDEFFAKFWATYPRRVGKKACLKIWVKLDPDESLVSRIMDTIEWHKIYLWKEALISGDLKYVPHPSTWLMRESWEEDPPLDWQNKKAQETRGPMLYPARDKACRE